MIKGATGKHLNYFLSSVFRLFGFLALLIAFIVVKITVKPAIDWLNILLICLAIGGLISGIFNLVLAGMTATGYKQNRGIQIVGVIITAVTGGIVSTTLTAVALATRVLDEEVENEKIIKFKGRSLKK